MRNGCEYGEQQDGDNQRNDDRLYFASQLQAEYVHQENDEEDQGCHHVSLTISPMHQYRKILGSRHSQDRTAYRHRQKKKPAYRVAKAISVGQTDEMRDSS